jgi:acetyl-CoA acetyltransferase
MTAITGIGMTPLYRESGRTVLDMAVEAARAAIADAGLEPADVDGVLSYQLGDSVPVQYVVEALGMREVHWHNDISGGGSQSASILGDAARAVDAGAARAVLVFRSLNGRSGKRLGQAALRVGADAEEQFVLPYGMRGPVHLFAMVAQRFLHERGLGEEDLAAVVRQSRANAAANPRATRREPMSHADYLASPMVASPLRIADCCQENDGAAALVVVSDARAAAGPRPAVRIRAVRRAGGPGASNIARSHDSARIFSHYVAPLVYAEAGLRPTDIDVALLYDAYSSLMLAQLEDFGLCPAGGSGELVRTGATAPDGPVPVNPHGGLLSEGSLHGFNNTLEAVRQLRGTAGTGQVAEARLALVAGFGGSYGSAAILERGS